MATAVVPGRATGQRHRGQLPAEVTSLVGRKAELTRLSAILASARLVTVVGPGGVGKTRVAIRVAQDAVERSSDRYPDGVVFAELSGINDPARVAPTVAACLGLTPGDDGDDLAAVVGHLRGRRPLIVLDTCEHVIDGCAALAEAILREVPGASLLATSRQPLDVPGEHTFPVAPLPVPGANDGAAAGTDDEAAAGHGDALDLFVQRATAAVPGFRLNADSQADAIALCQRLDGIPLGIELAAVRLRVLSLSDLVQRLDQLFRVLGGGRRGIDPRHQTLQTAIGWSYDLCTPAERTLWARLSTFPGAFDMAAAEQVCAAPDAAREEVVHTLIALVDKSVVLRDDTAASRYRLPGTLRQFGAKQLAAAGLGDTYRARHLSYYTEAARRFRRHVLDDDQPARFRELRRAHDDLRAAMEYALDDTAPDERVRAGAELAVRLHSYWLISGLLREGRDWLDRFHDRLPGSCEERAEVLIVRGCLGGFSGDCATGIADIREGIRLAAALGAGRLTARGHLYLNIIATFDGRPDEAAAAGAEAERLLTSTPGSPAGSPGGLLSLDIQLAHHYQLTGRPQLAIARCQRGLRRLNHTSERWLRGYLDLIASLAYLQLPGGQERSEAAAIRGLCAKHELGDVIGTAYGLDILARLAADSGRFPRAAWLTGAADPLWERAGKRFSGTPRMRQLHQQAVQAARECLGDQRFAALRAHGAAAPLDQAVAAAVGDADDLRGAPAMMALPQQADPEEQRGQGAKRKQRGVGAGAPLTSRERQIAELVASGLSNREIAGRLVISKRTVDAHVEHIFGKLGICSRVQLAVWLTDPPPADVTPPGQD
jgi:non-specific serine/threonine protein kinase